MTQDQLKKQAALAALDYVEDGSIIGMGTGSTVNFFIEALAGIRNKISGAVSSSEVSTQKLKAIGIPVYDLNTVGELSLYIDGADEANQNRILIKGGGGALTREKIIAAASGQFICIIDESKFKKVLGQFPLPIEVIPMARSYVAREIVKLGGDPMYRQGFKTDNGNIILDVFNFNFDQPIHLEERINNITGVVTHGLFATKPADMLLIATPQGVKKI